MHWLIAPDSLKDSLSSEELCKIAKQVIHDTYPNDRVSLYSMADGGEGSLAAISSMRKQRIKLKEIPTKSAIGEDIKGTIGILDDQIAIIELAEASGLQKVPHTKRCPFETTTYGTGLLIKAALNLGIREIVLFLGGSATNDCGLGIIAALGGRFLDEHGKEIPYQGPRDIFSICSVNLQNLEPKLEDTNIKIACDVTNPLLGINGATKTFARQKGAKTNELEILETAMKKTKDLLTRDAKPCMQENHPGMGAAGGSPFGIAAITKPTIVPGFKLLAEITGLKHVINNDSIDIVITAEGKIDKQTGQGKLISGLLELTKLREIPTIALAGQLEGDYQALYKSGLTAAFSIANKPMSTEESIRLAPQLVREKIQNLVRLIKAI